MDPQNLGEFRPISLVGCMCNILAKIISNRLKKILGESDTPKAKRFCRR